MPKPFHGEPVSLIEAGEYPAVITQVINCGHHQWKEKSMTKIWVEFWLPTLGVAKSLSNFGIQSWLSPSRPPFVGLYELISAVTKKEKMTQDEASEYNIYDLAGKSVKVVFGQNEKGYMNIVGVVPTDEVYKTEEPIIVMGTEDFYNSDLLNSINEKARSLVWTSDEFVNSNLSLNNVVEEVKDALRKNGALAEEAEKVINIEDIPW